MQYHHYFSLAASYYTFGLGGHIKLGSPILRNEPEEGQPVRMGDVGEFWGIEITFLIFQGHLGIVTTQDQ